MFMALGLLIATGNTSSGIFNVIFYFQIIFWAINELDFEHKSSQLMA